jgi:predicted nucleic acid-binding Zn ribbon protein
MRPLTQGLPGALEALLRDVPLSNGKVEFAWKAAVGKGLERVTAVRLEDRVLLVDVPDRNWAREITRSSTTILTRLQTLLGHDAITEIRVRKP